jgi:hypothetical protein
MATIPNHVQPGDLIASATINSIIDALTDHESRLAKLEGSTSVSAGNNVAITGLAPAGNLRIGDPVTIFGQNFGFSTGTQSVWFNSTRATDLDVTNSTDSKLIINHIPAVPEVKDQPTDVTLTVANFASSDWRKITLLPAQPQQQGSISLSFQGVSPTTITSNSTPIFTYNLSSEALLQTIVTIAPTISVSGVSLQVVGADGTTPLLNSQLTLAPSQSTQISVKASQIPAGVNSFKMTVAATVGGMTGSTDGPRDFSVGSPSPQPDPEVTIFTAVESNPPTALQNNVLTVKAGTTATVKFRAEFTGTDTRDYNFSGSVLPPATNWPPPALSQVHGFETHSPYHIVGSSVEFPSVDVTPSAGATSPAILQVVLQRVGSNFVNTATCSLAVSTG